MKRSQQGQSLVEYAIGIGCVSAVAMVALSFLGFIGWRIFHNIEHAVIPGGHGATSGHAAPIVNKTATPWVLD